MTWIDERRAAAGERFAVAELPSESQEVWRYSRIGDLDLGDYELVNPGDGGDPTLPAAVQELLDAIGPRSALLVTRDGRLVRREVEHPKLTAGPAEEAGPLDVLDLPHDALSALHDASAVEPLVVAVGRGVAIEHPVVVVHLVGATGAVVAPRLAVHAAEASQVTVVELWSSTDVDTLFLPVTTLVADQAANLAHVAVQELGPRVWSIAHQASRVDRDATLSATAVALGGFYARLRSDTALTGRGGSSALLAAYFGDGDQQHDFRTLQDHKAPNTHSELLFKGAVAGHSHGVYSGLIRVENGAKGTRAFQTNRNLVLSDTAHADSVPNLEIDENDLSCSHASAVGPIDDQQRFYLEARGVPPRVADRLIVAGFLAEVLERAAVPRLRAPLAARIAALVEAAVVEDEADRLSQVGA
jgi:Fe-S cluster assembly protein SufD